MNECIIYSSIISSPTLPVITSGQPSLIVTTATSHRSPIITTIFIINHQAKYVNLTSSLSLFPLLPPPPPPKNDPIRLFLLPSSASRSRLLPLIALITLSRQLVLLAFSESRRGLRRGLLVGEWGDLGGLEGLLPLCGDREEEVRVAGMGGRSKPASSSLRP